MNTTTARYTPLESLLLFQSLLSHGIEATAFLQISNLLQNNQLVKTSSHYDAGRLSPEALQELFLHLLREELRAESEPAEKPDGPGQSPNSRKRKLASPPLPTLQEARQHIKKLPILVDRLYARYRDHVVREIREDEERFDALQGQIRDIEASALAVKNVNNNDNAPPVRLPVPATDDQNGYASVQGSGIPSGVSLPNGGTPTPQFVQQQQQQQQPLVQSPPPAQPQQQVPRQFQAQPQPQPQPRVQPPPMSQPQPPVQQQQHQILHQSSPQPQLQPQQQSVLAQIPNLSRPHSDLRSEDARNGSGTPQPLSSPQERRDSATPPVLTPQHSVALQTQPSRLAAPTANPPARQHEQPRPQNGPPQVLQPPQGVGFPTPLQGPLPQQVQGEGLQRPEGIGRGKTSPAPLQNQPTVPGQLKWEPLYQPNQLPQQFRQPQGQGQYPQQQRPPSGPQAPQGQQQTPHPQWDPPVPSPYGSPRPVQAQPGASPDQPLQQPAQQQPVHQHAQHSSQQHPQQQIPQPQFQQQVLQQVQQPVQQTQVHQQARQQQGHQAQHVQQVQQPVRQAIQQAGAQPALAPPQKLGQFSPALQPAPAKTPSGQGPTAPPSQSPALSQPPAQQQRPPLPAGPLTPSAYAAHPPVPVFQGPPQIRALAAASPTPPSGPTQGSVPPPQRRRTGQPIAQRPPPVVQASGPLVAGPPGVSSYAPQNGPGVPPRSALPDHVLQQPHRQHAGAGTPTPVSRNSSVVSVAPHTPLQPPRRSFVLGSGTSWKLDKTPATPRAEDGEVPSPAYEPLSPVLPSAALSTTAPTGPAAPSALPHPSPTQTQSPGPETAKPMSSTEPQGSVSPVAKRRGRPPRSAQKALGPPTPAPSTLAPPAASGDRSVKETYSALVKHEETTPQPPTETGDTTADESVPGRRHVSRVMKRKRQDTASPSPAGSREPPGPPTHVVWTRSFNKVSHSAMEQIVGHRDANLFAHQIRERDAPGYRNRILMPQDLRSIRNAINHGNRAAAAAAAALPGGDPGTSSVLLPISEELVPPKGIVNSSQLDRELAHMLANAIMYNPDPNRGPGPAFMRSEAEVDAEDEENGGPVLGYKVDENGVVNNARAMFVEVEKLLSDMRAAEIQKGAPAAAAGAAALTGTSTRQASVAGGQGETPAKGAEAGSSIATDDREEQTPTEPETTATVPKRRRITRG